MFSQLIKSEARKAILELCTQNSRQKYYLRELASIIQYSPGSLQRELNSLVESGLLLSEKMGNMRFFFLNQKCPLLKELKIYLSQHTAQRAAPKPEDGAVIHVKMGKKLSPRSGKNRPVLEQNMSKIPAYVYAEKQDKEGLKQEVLTQPTIQPTTQSTTPPSVTSMPPVTPFSHIEPPTFSRPVLHKPYLEKPRLGPIQSEPTYTPNFNPHVEPAQPSRSPQPPPPAESGTSTDIEIHIE